MNKNLIIIIIIIIIIICELRLKKEMMTAITVKVSTFKSR